MSETKNDKLVFTKFEQWIKKLQQESWELELLISGFSILLMLEIPGVVDFFTNQIIAKDSFGDFMILFASFLQIFKVVAYIIAANLFIHVGIRGIWVGLIGLSSVFPNGIKYERLKRSHFSEKKNQDNRFDQTKTILKLDKLASSIFSFSLLIVCFLLSFTIYFSGVVILGFSSDLTYNSSSKIFYYFFNILIAIYIFMGLFLFIDFLSGGFLQRVKKLSRLLYYIDFLISRFTLSFLYRNIFYILITNISKRIVFPIICLYLCISGIFLFHDSFSSGEKYPINLQNKNLINSFVDNNKYDSLRKQGQPIQSASIEDFIVEKDYLKLFIKFRPSDMEILKNFCSDLKPFIEHRKSIRFFYIRLYLNPFSKIPRRNAQDMNEAAENSLKCLKKMYQININNQKCSEVEYFFTEHGNLSEKGILAIVSLNENQQGRCILQVLKKKPIMKKNVYIIHSTIPFIRTLYNSMSMSPKLP